MRPIVLCATQRCGSTMVVEDMRNTGVLGLPAEYFIPWKPGKRKYAVEDVERILRRAETPNGVSAVKVMANQAALIDAALGQDPAEGQDPHLRRFFEVFDGAAWIFIRREDVVAQAVSRVMAMQTGIRHATGDGSAHFADKKSLRGYSPNYNRDARYAPRQIAEAVGSIAAANAFWRRFFRAYGIEPIELVYENVAVDDSLSHLDRIAEAAGVGALEKTQRAMVKIGNSLNDEWVVRFLSESARRNFRV